MSNDLPTVKSTGTINGAMDGIRVPANQLELVKGVIISQLGKYSYVTKSVRPWREFLVLNKPPSAGDIIIRKIQTNVVYYQSNYLMLVTAFLLFSVLTSPSALLLIAIIGAGWGFLLKKNEDPNYMLVVAGIPLAKTQRTIAAAILSGILILIFAGSLILSVLGISAVAVGAHAALNDANVPSQLENVSEDDPINQI
jgi:hypothetical protein